MLNGWSRRPSLPVVLVGAGGHAKVVLDILERAGRYRVLGVFDDEAAKWGGRLGGHRIVGGVEELFARWHGRAAAVVAIGDNHARRRVAGRLAEHGIPLATAVHPTAVVGGEVTLGAGTVVMALGVVNPGTVTGRGVVVNTSASVDHDCVLGDWAFVGPGARLAGGVRVGELSLVGTGATVIPGRAVGRNARVGAGAVVIDDVPDDVTVVGTPARVVVGGAGVARPSTVPAVIPCGRSD